VRWILLILSLVCILVGVFTSTVDAGTQEVTVTASGIVIQCPGGLVLNYVSNYEVIISWTNPPGSTNITALRATVGREPTGPTDGYLVYQGTNTTATDWINLDGIGETIYYRAYGMDVDGTFSLCFASGDTGGVSMHITGSWLLVGLIALSLGLTWLSLKADLILFRIAGFLCWASLAFMFFTNVFGTDIGDSWTTLIAFLFLVMAFATLLLQMNSEIKHEKKGMSWSTWGSKPKEKAPSAYATRRAELRKMLGRRK